MPGMVRVSWRHLDRFPVDHDSPYQGRHDSLVRIPRVFGVGQTMKIEAFTFDLSHDTQKKKHQPNCAILITHLFKDICHQTMHFFDVLKKVVFVLAHGVFIPNSSSCPTTWIAASLATQDIPCFLKTSGWQIEEDVKQESDVPDPVLQYVCPRCPVCRTAPFCRQLENVRSLLSVQCF